MSLSVTSYSYLESPRQDTLFIRCLRGIICVNSIRCPALFVIAKTLDMEAGLSRLRIRWCQSRRVNVDNRYAILATGNLTASSVGSDSGLVNIYDQGFSAQKSLTWRMQPERKRMGPQT